MVVTRQRALSAASVILAECLFLTGCTAPAPTSSKPIDTAAAVSPSAPSSSSTVSATPAAVHAEDSGSAKGAQGKAELIAPHEYRYVVAPDDTLWNIRQRFGVCNADIQPFDVAKPELGVIHELTEGETVRIVRVGNSPPGSELCMHGGS